MLNRVLKLQTNTMCCKSKFSIEHVYTFALQPYIKQYSAQYLMQ